MDLLKRAANECGVHLLIAIPTRRSKKTGNKAEGAAAEGDDDEVEDGEGNDDEAEGIEVAE